MSIHFLRAWQVLVGIRLFQETLFWKGEVYGAAWLLRQHFQLSVLSGFRALAYAVCGRLLR